MYTYNTFERSKNNLLTLNQVEEEKIDYGESITDKSKYNPNASSFIANQGAINATPLYHFNDGVDNGLNMAIITDSRLDVTEKEALYNKLKKQTGKAIDEMIEQIEETERSEDSDHSVYTDSKQKNTEVKE